MTNALSFDVEEYFHAEVFAGAVRPEEWPGLASCVADATGRILDVLDGAGSRATFFVLGWVAQRHPRLVREIHTRGHEIACHGYGHGMISRLTPATFADDVKQAKATLEDAASAPVIGYRAPTFSIMRETLWALEVLCEAGFRYDSSIFPIRHDRYGIPDAPRFPHRLSTPAGEIAEFPLSTLAFLGQRVPIAGGGYFRLLPYGFTQRGIRRLNQREGQPAIVYLHPWEMDPRQPLLPPGWLARVRHTINIKHTEAKLRRLLADFDFLPVSAVLERTGLLVGGDIR